MQQAAVRALLLGACVRVTAVLLPTECSFDTISTHKQASQQTRHRQMHSQHIFVSLSLKYLARAENHTQIKRTRQTQTQTKSTGNKVLDTSLLSLTEQRRPQPPVQAAILVIPDHASVVHQRNPVAEVEDVPGLLLRLRVDDLEAALMKNLHHTPKK